MLSFYEFALFLFHVRIFINLKSVFWIWCTLSMVCTAGLNINEYVKCTIKSTFQNKLLFCQHNEPKCTFQVRYGLKVWDFQIWFFKFCAFKRVICQMEMSFLRYQFLMFHCSTPVINKIRSSTLVIKCYAIYWYFHDHNLIWI